MSDSDVVIIDDTVEEVTVYGNDGGGTDTISIPADFYNYYGGGRLPSVVIVAPPPSDGGGGGDVPTQDEVTDTFTYIAAGFGVASLFASGGWTVVLGGASIIFGLAAYENDKDRSIRPQPDYPRPAGSTIPPRSLSLAGPPRADKALQQLLKVERTRAVFTDAMECTLGAMLAADADWTQRHALAAAVAYGDLGEAFLGAAETLQDLAPQLRAAAAQANGAVKDPAGKFGALLADARPVLGLSADDEAHLTKLIVPALARGIPSEAEVRSAVRALRQRGRWLVDPLMKKVRFVFVAGPPPATHPR